MAAGDRRRPAATLPAVLILVCVLVASASGLQMLPDDDPNTFPDSSWSREFWYRRGEVIVIDLGNTNSCVAGYTGSGKTTTHDNDDTMFQFCIPSWVAFTDNGTALVGEAAKNHAAVDPAAAIFGFKRLLGQRRNRWYEEDIVQGVIQRVPYKIGTGDYDDTTVVQVTASDGSAKELKFVDVAAMVVAELKSKAEEHLGRTVKYAVMTNPFHFAAGHRGELAFSGWLAGLDVVRMVREQTAVAAAHGLHAKLRERGGAALVLRVGGGTSDASVVVLLDGRLRVFRYRGDPFLGGDDFDGRLVDYFAKRIKMKHGVDIGQNRIALRRLRTACENAKKALSSQDHVQVTVESLIDGVDFSEPLSRSQFEQLNDDLFHKAMELVEHVMARAGIEKSKNKIMELVEYVMARAGIEKSKNKMISEIVLVGGSAMIPKIQSLVKDYFNGREPTVLVKPDEAIAPGAAIYVHSPDNYYFVHYI